MCERCLSVRSEARCDTDASERFVPKQVTGRAGAGQRGNAGPGREIYSRAVRSRKAFPITETELMLMAAAAIIGLSSQPNTG